MGERIWDKFLTERDKAVFELAGYGVRQGFRQKAGAFDCRRQLCAFAAIAASLYWNRSSAGANRAVKPLGMRFRSSAT